MTRQHLLQQLRSMADSKNADFCNRINHCATPSLGVRVPILRQLARQAAMENPSALLDELETATPQFHEEHVLCGLLIGAAALSDQERKIHLDRWVSGILSWADCDCGCSSLKFIGKCTEAWDSYCTKWLTYEGEFQRRFALVTLMQYFIQADYIDRLLDIFAADHGDAYYVRMAQAWALSVCFIKFRDKTLTLLQKRNMDPWVQNKTIQKCQESYRVSMQDKALLKTLKC